MPFPAFESLIAGCRRLLEQPHQLFAMGLVAGLHALLLLAMLVTRIQAPPAVTQEPIAVSFVAESRRAERPVSTPRPEIPAPATIQMPLPPRPSFSEIAVSVPTENVVQQAAVAPTPVVAAAEARDAVVPPDYTAAYLNNPGPQYPYVSRRRREQGTVLLRVLVDARGAPVQVQIGRSSGFVDLDEAAADIVRRRWRFVAAMEGNVAVEAWVEIPIEFSLKDR